MLFPVQPCAIDCSDYVAVLISCWKSADDVKRSATIFDRLNDCIWLEMGKMGRVLRGGGGFHIDSCRCSVGLPRCVIWLSPSAFVLSAMSPMDKVKHLLAVDTLSVFP